MQIKGQIDEIIYQNEVNGYTICTIETEENEIITAVGYLPFINVGDTLKLEGNFVTHQEYGEQFKITTFEKQIPETKEALEKYLSGGVIKGVGPTTAKRIVEKFGEETIPILKFEPDKLSTIKGISKAKAKEISEEFNEKWELWQIVGFLEKFGISASNAKKVYKELGEDAITEIEKNPYILIDITYGVDFLKIDKMAMDLGIPYNNEKRIESAIKYSLLISSYNGHTCVLKENLIQFVEQLLNVNETDIENALINSNANKKIVIEKREEKEWIYLYPFYKAEMNIAERINVMLKTRNVKYIDNFDKLLETSQTKSDILLSEKQKEAIKMINDNNICVITGGPGTGKTTIIKTIIDIYTKNKMKVVLCAPTGRAAKRITETTGVEAKTIHRLLEIGKIEEEQIENVDYQTTPIDGDVVVIDEMSMVDVILMNHLTKSMYLGTKLILVGDINQLSSVGPGNVLKDIIKSEKIPTIELNTIFRQAAKSKIVVNAHNINNGFSFTRKYEEKDNLLEIPQDAKQDFFYINESKQDKILENILSLCKERLKKYNNYDFFKNIQLITPTKKGNLGTKELNKQLQEALNPKRAGIPEKQYGGQIFRQGDRIMQIKNNYDIFWEKRQGKYESGTGVFNGEIGRLTKIDEKEKQLKITFDDNKEAWYNFTDLEQLDLAYAITVHKAQRK